MATDVLFDIDYHKQEWNTSNFTISKALEISKHALNIQQNDEYKIAMSKYQKFLDLLIHHRKLAEEEDDTDKEVEILKLMQIVYYSKELYSNVYFMNEALHSDDFKHNEDTSLCKFMARDNSDLNKYQSFIMWCYRFMEQHKYKKMGDCVCEEIIVNGIPTRAWKKVDTIYKVLSGSVNKEVNYEQFLNITSGVRDMIKSTAQHLEKVTDSQFPNLVKDRHIFSFTNGIYICNEDEFVPYEDLKNRKHLEHVVSSKFFPVLFPEEEENIETPSLDLILTYQDLPQEVIDVIYAFIGRMIYTLDEKDSWQCLMYFVGQAGTGKSTITSVCKELYEDEDVGVMSNNIQKQFGLSDLLDKMIYIAPEIKRDFSIDQSEFQSMISGDKINVAVKYSASRSVNWSIPGIMAGNEVPDFIDNSGSIQRRIVTVRFDKKVKDGDLQLLKKIRSEMGNIIAKCNRTYLKMANEFGNTTIWNILPDYFRKTQRELAAATNPFVHLLCSEKMEYKKDLYIPESVLKQLYNTHCMENNYKRQRWNQELYIGPCQQFQITIKRDTLAYGGKERNENFFMGIDYKDPEEEY